jgi:adenine phosphoribosyltransferase
MTGPDSRPSDARRHVLQQFRWIGGDADTWSMLRDGDSFAAIVDELCALLTEADTMIDVVVGIEARGFILGGAVAARLGVGFAPIRKDGALFPGDTESQTTAPDYRGRTSELHARRDHLTPGTRVAVVDDWIETGSSAIAAARLIERCGATLTAVAVIVDDASDAARAVLPPIRSIVTGADLPSADQS